MQKNETVSSPTHENQLKRDKKFKFKTYNHKTPRRRLETKILDSISISVFDLTPKAKATKERQINK